jgi:hypothetical protein
MSLTASCLCGAVRYQPNSEPASSGHCYRADCRKATGGGHLTIVAVPDASVTVTGTIRSHSRPAGSGQLVERFFCPTSGSTLYSRPQAMAGLTMLHAGTLENPRQVAPPMSIVTSRAVAWDPPAASLPGFPELPPRR